jgi:leader peptidase (prepilin peptidase)/N-methyltransferase
LIFLAALKYLLLFFFGIYIGAWLNILIKTLPDKVLHGFTFQQPPASRFPTNWQQFSAWLLTHVTLVQLFSKIKKETPNNTPFLSQNLFIEIVSALTLMWAVSHFPSFALAISAYLFLMALLLLAVIDYKTCLLPDVLTIPLMALGLALNSMHLFVDFKSSVVGAIAGYFILWSSYQLYKLITKKEGMGHGDFKLLAAIGAWLGWQGLIPTILISSLTASVVGLALIGFRKIDRHQVIPFGPFLSLGAVFCLLLGNV